MRKDCKYYEGETSVIKKKGCRCNKTYKEEKIPASICSLFGKVKELICDNCKRFRKKK
jgi:hypothetical protein